MTATVTGTASSSGFAPPVATAPIETTARRARRRRAADALYLVLLLLLAVLFAFPLFWTIASSLKAPYEILAYPPVIFPAHPQWGNYVRVFTKAPFGQWIFNTVFVVVMATLGSVLSSSVAAYSFARFRYRGRDLIFIITLGTLLLPSQVTLIPQYVLFLNLGWVDTILPLVVPKFLAADAFFIFLMVQFFRGLPRELDEAAMMDGCGPWRIYWKIVMPLSLRT